MARGEFFLARKQIPHGWNWASLRGQNRFRVSSDCVKRQKIWNAHWIFDSVEDVVSSFVLRVCLSAFYGGKKGGGEIRVTKPKTNKGCGFSLFSPLSNNAIAPSGSKTAGITIFKNWRRRREKKEGEVGRGPPVKYSSFFQLVATPLFFQGRDCAHHNIFNGPDCAHQNIFNNPNSTHHSIFHCQDSAHHVISIQGNPCRLEAVQGWLQKQNAAWSIFFSWCF